MDHISNTNLSWNLCFKYRSYEGCDGKVCHFNTALAFDREGQIICQYHKYNLYGSEQLYLDKPFYPKGVYFETDFGEKVGLLICFDINFAELVKLLNVDAIAYPVAWTDELPFLTGKI